MAQMGKYCKAYPAGRVKEFSGWKEIPAAAPQGKTANHGTAANGTAQEDAARDYFFIQENYTVTRGIFIDEDVVFNETTDEWKAFCKDQLEFELPQ